MATKTLTKLSDNVRAELDRLSAALSAAEQEVSTKVDLFNLAMEGPAEELTAAVAAYNELVAEVEQVRDGAQQEVQDYFDERSEKWQESDKGQAYQTWINDLESLSFSSIEIETPDAIEEPEYDARAVLDEEFPLELPETF